LAEVTFLSGECYERLGENETAGARYRTVVDRFPASPYAATATARLRAITP
jgi:TolA-binding protein